MELVTRSDLDGLVAGAILLDAGIIDEGKVRFVHPKDVQDGKIELDEQSITTNLPFDPRVGLAFDHHESEGERLGEEEEKAVRGGKLYLEKDANSAARVVYNYYNERGLVKHISEELVAAADKCDSADLDLNDILNPTGWVLLHYIMDARSGFGRFHEFQISNYELMMKLMHFVIDHSIDEVMELPDVKERVKMYFDHELLAEEQIRNVTKLVDNVAVIDLRNEDTIWTGNRFKVYAMYPSIKYSIHVAWGKQKQNTAIMIGKSIVNKSGTANVGEICLSYGGGGHAKAGTCQVDNRKANEVVDEIVSMLQ